MSLDTERASIAAALATVPGIRGYQYRTPAPVEGDAWPTGPRLDLDRGLVWRPSWSVVIVMPQDERAATTWVDTTFLSVVGALRDRTGGFPDGGEFVQLATDAGPLLAFEITMRSH